MEKYFNTVAMTFGVFGGVIVSYLGGMDAILHAILFLVVIDYITGLALS
ncbi:holin, partial [Klebsiella oxytoca]